MNYNKKNKYISRREFLLVEYINEVLNPTRRSFGGMLGGAFAMALGINPNKSQAKDLKIIENKIKMLVEKFSDIDLIENSIFVIEGRIPKIKITSVTEEEKTIILNKKEAFALSHLSETKLDMLISKINSSVENEEDAFDYIKYLIESLAKNYKEKQSKKTKKPEIEEIDLDLDDEENINKKSTVFSAEQFKKECFEILEKYKKSYKTECILLESILRNSTYRLDNNNKIIINRYRKGDETDYDERDLLIKHFGKKFGNDISDQEIPDGSAQVLIVSVSPEKFVSEYIKCINKFINNKKDYKDNKNILMFFVAFGVSTFNKSNEIRVLIRKINPDFKVIDNYK